MAETIADRLSVLHPKWNRTKLRRLVADGRVRVNGVVIRRFNHPVAETDNVAIAATAPPARPVPVSQNFSHRTIYEDADIVHRATANRCHRTIRGLKHLLPA